MQHYTDTAIYSEDILNISRRTSFELDPGLTRHGAFGPGILKVVTKNGQEHSKRIETPLGSPERPLTFDDCASKFLDCSSYSIKPIPKERAERAVNMIGQLEKLEDVTEIIELLNGKSTL